MKKKLFVVWIVVLLCFSSFSFMAIGTVSERNTVIRVPIPQTTSTSANISATNVDTSLIRARDPTYSVALDGRNLTILDMNGPGQVVTTIYEISRAYISFDTSSVPTNATITSAVLFIYTKAVFTFDYNVTFTNTNYGTLDKNDWNATGTYEGIFFNTSILTGVWGWESQTVTNPNLINKTGLTQYQFKTEREGIVPIGNEYGCFIETFAGGLLPSLNITYILPTHTPIRINNNTEFNAINGVNSGSGTSVDPYIINNWIIDGADNGSCIYIGNTTKHFIIRNCSLNNTSGFPTTQYFYDSGIHLYNVTNGIVYNNTLFNNGRNGIYLENYSEGNITFNVVQTSVYGINLKNASNIMVRNSTITNNNQGIIVKFDSQNISMTNNTITNSGNEGILIENLASNCSIYHNKFINNVVHALDQGTNILWNNSYSSGGNYWDNYTGVDNYHGSNQDILGSDNIGDTPYILASLTDYYPLMLYFENYSVIPPVANAGLDDFASNGTIYMFDGTESYTSAGLIVNYTWNISINGTWFEVYGETPTFTFWNISENPYNVILNITNNNGLYDNDSVLITVLEVHSPIRIDSDAEFTTPNGVRSGSGTLGDPYLIEGWYINGTGAGDCIFIGNTTAHFRIENNTLLDTTTIVGLYHKGAGTQLFNVTNGTLHDNNITITDYGVYTQNFNGNITNNTITQIKSGGVGIYLLNSDNSTIRQNNINVDDDGIELSATNYTTIDDNNIVAGNEGIIILGHHNNITFNRISGMGANDDAIYMEGDNLIISNNTIDCSALGVKGIFGNINGPHDNITIDNNTMNNVRWGLYLHSELNTIVTSNNLYNTTDKGIFINSGVTVMDNNHIIHNNTFTGLDAATYTVKGIHVVWGTNITITNNSVSNAESDGILVGVSTKDSVVKYNTVDNLPGGLGIHLDASTDNITVQHNTVNDVGLFALFVDIGSTNNIITNNNFTNNNNGVWIAHSTSTGNSVYHNNFINTAGTTIRDDGTNTVVDKGSEFGGNYYSDYVGVDNYYGTFQDIFGSDNLGDTLYLISGTGIVDDEYPLMLYQETNNTPVAHAGFPPQSWGGLRRLYGNESSDAGGTSLNYTWNFTYGGSPIILYGRQVDFWFNITGVYNITLNVTDDSYNINSTYVIYNISDIPVFFDEGIRTDATGVVGNVTFDTILGRKVCHKLDVDGTTSTSSYRILPECLYNKTFIFTWVQNLTLGTGDNTTIYLETNTTTNGFYQIIFENGQITLGSTSYSINIYESEWMEWTAIVDNITRKVYVYRNDIYIGFGSNTSASPNNRTVLSLYEAGGASSSEWYIDETVWYNYTLPIANAGPDQTGFEAIYNFDGSASTGAIFNYTWNFTFNGTPITLWGVNPSFDFDRSGNFSVTLNVSNPITYSTDIIWVNITNQLPVSDAGPNDSTYRGTYNFDGTGSYDLDGYITNYTWRFTYNTSMRYMYGSTPSYWFWTLGVYLVILNVTDDEGDYHENTMLLTVLNTPPVANAGPNQAGLKDVYLFDGSGSYDLDGSITNYTWNFTYNASARFMYGAFPNYYFYTNGTYLITLNVTDNDSGTGTDTLWVNISWLPPVADAGPNQAGKRIITFDGSGSSDGDGWIANYTWNFTYDGGPETIWGVGPSFDFNISGVYIVMLNVTDNDGLYSYDNVTITITILSPVADAGPDQAGLRDTYDFDGSASSDTDGTIINYTWTFTYNASGRTIYGISPDYYFYTDGNYQVTLNVTDNDWRYDEDTMWVNITLATPVPVMSYTPFDDNKGIKTVDGSSSYDPDGYITNFTWTFTYDATPYTYYTQFFAFNFSLEGSHVITLNLTDHDGLQDEDTITITIVFKDPVAVAEDDRYEQSWTDMILNGSQSTDEDGYIVNWTWEFTYDNVSYVLYGEVVTFHLGTANGTVNITLTVTDDDGLTDTDTMIVIVINPITAASNFLLILLPLLIAILVMYLIYRLMRKTEKDLRKKGGN